MASVRKVVFLRFELKYGGGRKEWLVICSASAGEGEGQNERTLGRLVSETSWSGRGRGGGEGAGRGMTLCTFFPARLPMLDWSLTRGEKDCSGC